ncbi:response regulator transcription factor [Streptomyces tanashiensis]|jgi:DNA-binding response OmpR family regulator|uniref:Response regulator transcription factor n=1 Tax=Streptomyces tanashiensis TaxID=67367 RepID=A0ABY6QTH7_9ACTN|nr:response regulator transcription factor [Streptomyces tanashiensis]UZX20972.1 response regulator transcription factor [Streptomyces tanashiensis]
MARTDLFSMTEIDAPAIVETRQMPLTGAIFHPDSLPCPWKPTVGFVKLLTECWGGSNPEGDRMRVLVVEDERDQAESLIDGLRRHGHDTIVAGSGAEALDAFENADLVLLDLGLPDIDGIEVCRRMRAAGDTPIISFAGESAELDRILGLQAGSDDCLERPYSFRELMARIDAVMRRVGARIGGQRRPTLSRGGLSLDSESREVVLDGRPIPLTRKEFDLLHYLASRPGVVVSRQRLMIDVWGHPADAGLSAQASRTIDTHVSSMRSKLRESGWILTVRGVGFRFRQE